MILYLEHHFLQTVFFEKINASQLTEQLADFVAQLQRIGVTMQAYNGAFNNTTHPIAIDAKRNLCRIVDHPQTKKRRLLIDMQLKRQQLHHQMKSDIFQNLIS